MIPGVFTQFTTAAGDIDDCWCYATMWCAEACRHGIAHPSLTRFRANAGDPDDGKRDGGNLTEVVTGARVSYPGLSIIRYDGPFNDYLLLVKEGRPASTAVWSARLSRNYGHQSGHQVGIVWDGKQLLVMNPLARAGSTPTSISEAELRAATTDANLGYGGNVRAAIFPVMEDDMGVVGIADGPTLSGMLRVTVDTQTIPCDGSARDPIRKGAIRHALGRYKLPKLADRRVYLITENTKPSYIAASAVSFDPWEAQDTAALQAAINAAIVRDRSKARITYE